MKKIFIIWSIIAWLLVMAIGYYIPDTATSYQGQSCYTDIDCDVGCHCVKGKYSMIGVCVCPFEW